MTNLRIGSIVILVTFLITLFPLTAATDNCITCHQDWEEEDGPSYKSVRDVHFQKGLTCSSCHGGDSDLEDMDEVRQSTGYRGVPDHLEVPQFCAGCHSDAAYMHEHNPSLATDQLSKYRTSEHGQRLFEGGDRKVANCVSCHSVHEIADSRLPYSSTHPLNLPSTCAACHSDKEYMKEYGLPTDQFEEYRVSVHGQALLEKDDLGAPACNDCHGNHGARPPGTSSLSAVCGNCHAMESQLFASSPHAAAFEENEFPMCGTCHNHHRIERPSDEMVGIDESAVCSECHSTDDGTDGPGTAQTILNSLSKLVTASDAASEILNDARAKGMMTTDEEFLMKEVEQSLIQARTMVHAFNSDSVSSKAQEGVVKADSVRVSSASLIEDYHFRRKGLGIATLIITVLAILLYLRIRRIEKGN